MSYLQTKRAERDFYEIMLRNRYNSRETLNEWQSFLVKQGINENDVIPYRIVSSIETAISTNDVLKQFNFRYGMEPGKLLIDISNNSAGGHKKLNGKNEQTSNLTTRIINPEAIYKLQSLDKMTYMSDASIVNWIITELPKHVANQIAKQILIGGVKNEDGSDYDAIYPIATDAITVKETDYYSTIDQVFAFLLDAIANIDGSYQNRVLFLNPKDYADIVRQLSTQQTAIFLNPAALGARIVTTQLIDPSDDTTFTGIAVNTDNYLIGVANKDDSLLTSFDISKNAQYIEASAWAAGSLFKINSAYAIILKLSNPNLIVNPKLELPFSTAGKGNYPLAGLYYTTLPTRKTFTGITSDEYFGTRYINGEYYSIFVYGYSTVSGKISVFKFDSLENTTTELVFQDIPVINTFRNAFYIADDEYIYRIAEAISGSSTHVEVDVIKIIDGIKHTVYLDTYNEFIRGATFVKKNELLLMTSPENSFIHYNIYNIDNSGAEPVQSAIYTDTSVNALPEYTEIDTGFFYEDNSMSLENNSIKEWNQQVFSVDCSKYAPYNYSTFSDIMYINGTILISSSDANNRILNIVSTHDDTSGIVFDNSTKKSFTIDGDLNKTGSLNITSVDNNNKHIILTFASIGNQYTTFYTSANDIFASATNIHQSEKISNIVNTVVVFYMNNKQYIDIVEDARIVNGVQNGGSINYHIIYDVNSLSESRIEGSITYAIAKCKFNTFDYNKVSEHYDNNTTVYIKSEINLVNYDYGNASLSISMLGMTDEMNQVVIYPTNDAAIGQILSANLYYESDSDIVFNVNNTEITKIDERYSITTEKSNISSQRYVYFVVGKVTPSIDTVAILHIADAKLEEGNVPTPF